MATNIKFSGEQSKHLKTPAGGKATVRLRSALFTRRLTSRPKVREEVFGLRTSMGVIRTLNSVRSQFIYFVKHK